MKSHSSKAPSRETVIKAIRRAVKKAGGKRVTMEGFLVASRMKSGDVFRNFRHWQDALDAAGFTANAPNAKVEINALLADWGALARALQRLPLRNEYMKKGNYCCGTLENRFGGWARIPDAFRAFASERPEWNDLQELVSESCAPRRSRFLSQKPPGHPKSRWFTRRERRRREINLPVCGAPLNFGVFRYAPMNENGLILLFGSMAERLGFFFETVHPSFPDCRAVRQACPEIWETVRIEFGYQSRNFREHGHDPKACDLIVCWEHNWPECPVEVLALKDEIKRLQAEAVLAN
jgi:hypothetical protein